MARVKRPGPGYPIDVAKINVDLFDWPEIVAIPASAQLAYLRSILWCRKHGTYQLPRVNTETSLSDTRHLLDAGLWGKTPSGPLHLLDVGAFHPWPTRVDSATSASIRRRRSHIRYHLAPQLLDAADHTCLTCGATDDLTIDHIIPMVKGGTDNPSNLQVLCRQCNSRKKDRT